ncbi:unnamed protein product [Cuscuta europaea]|uniref:Uncharacterized protein n=1 Tax=Cuscuta europaea TaxID=41803 RepID=A0A9P0ZFX1_CUSEU|nr:unnamed protein product [Cuscuta europaea]
MQHMQYLLEDNCVLQHVIRVYKLHHCFQPNKIYIHTNTYLFSVQATSKASYILTFKCFISAFTHRNTFMITHTFKLELSCRSVGFRIRDTTSSSSILFSIKLKDTPSSIGPR